jgi:cell division protein FtsI (penicillin-binding protein 3)
MGPKLMYSNIVPDVTGMGLRDAVYVLEKSGLKVEVKGKGKVRGQSLTPGTKIVQEQKQSITLQLS